MMKPLSNLTKGSDPIHVREQVAEKLNVSNGQLYKIQRIYENEEKISDTIKQLDTQKISVHMAYQQLLQIEHKEQPTKIEPPKSYHGLMLFSHCNYETLVQHTNVDWKEKFLG